MPSPLVVRRKASAQINELFDYHDSWEPGASLMSWNLHCFSPSMNEEIARGISGCFLNYFYLIFFFQKNKKSHHLFFLKINKIIITRRSADIPLNFLRFHVPWPRAFQKYRTVRERVRVSLYFFWVIFVVINWKK